MNPTRVAVVLGTIGLGGVPEVAYHLLRHLTGRDLAFELLVLKHEAKPDAARREREERFAALGVPIHHVDAPGSKLGTIAAVAQWLEERSIDILHTHSYRPNVYARLGGVLRRPHGLRIVPHYHNLYDDKWERERAMLVLERQLAATTDAAIAVSDAVRRHVEEKIGIAEHRIDVVPNAVDTAAFQGIDRTAARRWLGIADEVPLIGTIGRICEQKGQADLVESATRLAARHRSAVFVMTGDVEDKTLHARLSCRIAEAGLGERVRFLGHVTDIAKVYAALDIVVAPSRWEGLPLTLMEAMAAGKPVIATPVGGVPELVRDGETAILVPARDPAALAAAISALLDDPLTRARLGAEARRRQAGLGWQRAADQVGAIYDRVMGGQGRLAA